MKVMVELLLLYVQTMSFMICSSATPHIIITLQDHLIMKEVTLQLMASRLVQLQPLQ